MNSLVAFIPMDRRLALAQGEELPDRTTGSVLFADISGFTPLTAALAQELGIQRGAEEVLNQINPVYEALIAELHRYGGSVMGFAGDSITCWLDADNGHRAVACALAMQTAMEPFSTVKTPAGTPITLAIKVAVAAGPARRWVVGDPSIQLIDVLAGQTLDHVANAEKYAEKGEVVVGQEVVDNLRGYVDVSEWRGSEDAGERFALVTGLSVVPPPCPHPQLAPDAIPDGVARPWVLAPVYERLMAGSRFLAELRPTVALFLKFTGIDYDNDESAGEKLAAYIRWLQQTIQKQEGFLIQLTMGDKGSYAYASFGAPVAHADDAERAVAAALDLLYLPPELDFVHDIQIGISRGRIWAGECGAQIRHTYGVMGNEVNMAARLMSKAHPGQILVRRRVAEVTERSFQYEQLGLITVKGGAEPIAVSEVVGRQHGHSLQTSQYDGELVARECELAQLGRLLDNVLAGSGQLVTLQGVTGIGKSHLAAAFRESALAEGVQVATGTCQRISQSITYFPWQQALRQILGLAPGPAADQTQEAYIASQIDLVQATLQALNPMWHVRIPLIGDLLGLPIPDNPTTAAFEPRQRQETLFALVLEIIRAWTSSQPLLLLFDNVHWMDEPSRALVEALARASADMPVMMLLVSRQDSEMDGGEELLANLAQLPIHSHLPVDELRPEGIRQLVRNILGGQPSLLASRLIEAKSQGNPFFTRELIDALQESGQILQQDGEWILSEGMINALRAANALTREGGTWVLAESADLSAISLGIPDSIHGVILARIDRLPETHKPTLKVASVIGYSFEIGLLAQVHPERVSDVLLKSQADNLERRDFIFHDYEAEAASTSATYTFRQQATQEVSYETLLFTQRRELHRALAKVLEEQSADAVDPIAYHAYLGEDWPRSMRYHLSAGLSDKQLFANLQSVDHFNKALTSANHLEADETLAERQTIHANLGELLLTTGQYDASTEHLRESLSLAEQLGDPDLQARACRWIARSFELRAQYASALEWIDRGLGLLADRLTSSSLELRLIAGLIYSRQGDYRQAHEQALASLLAAMELDEKSIVARAHNLLGIIDRLRGNMSQAAQHFEEALDIYRQVGDLQGQALAQNSLANAYSDMGQWSEADRYYRQAGKTFTQLGDVYRRLLVDNNLGDIALNQGRLDDAHHFFQQALSTLEQIGGSLWVRGALHLNLGATQVKRGELQDAFEHFATSRRLFDEADVRDLLPELHRRLAEAYLAENEFGRALEEASNSLVVAEELAMSAERGQAARILGEVLLARGELEAAEERLNEAIERLMEVGDDYACACAQLTLARLNKQLNRTEQAALLIDQCLPVFERLGATRELAAARSLTES